MNSLIYHKDEYIKIVTFFCGRADFPMVNFYFFT